LFITKGGGLILNLFVFFLIKGHAHISYINFPYLGIKNYMNAYYGQNADRLICVKNKYDPENLFSFPQSIV